MNSKRRVVLSLTIFILAAWILAGLIGHEPWKQDEAYTFGLVYQILKTGDHVVPTLGDQPFMEKPPVFFWTAAVFARVFSPPLSLPDAARLTSGLYMLVTIIFLGLACRELNGARKMLLAPLALLGCVGLLKYGHLLLTDLALLASFAVALYSLSIPQRRPVLAGVIGGCGLGLGFLSKGFLGPGIIVLTALLLPVFFRAWRTRHYVTYFITMLVVAIPWVVVWPLALYLKSPQLFIDWVWDNNFGRFFGFHRDYVNKGLTIHEDYFLWMFLWFGFPIFHLAAWSLWKERAQCLKTPAIQLPLLLFLVTFTVLTIATNTRELYALPLLLPLALLSVRAADFIDPIWSSGIKRFCIMAFGALALLLWLAWVGMQLGYPEWLKGHLHNYAPAYMPVFSLSSFTPALLMTLVWLATIFFLSGEDHTYTLVHWTGGLTLCWVLVMTLWLPLIDSTRSYRAMLLDMKAALPAQYSQVARMNVGEPLRALIEYHAGFVPHALDENGMPKGDLLLIELEDDDAFQPPDDSWKLIWEGKHVEDRVETYRLFQHQSQMESME